jgi:AraC family transcriptional regulator
MSEGAFYSQPEPEKRRNGEAVRAAPGARMFGSSLADVFKTPAYDCRVLGPDQKPEFAITRLRSGPRATEKAPEYPPDHAILICVALMPAAVGQWRARYNGQWVGVSQAIPFAATFIDLTCKMEMWVSGAFDYLHYYLSRDLLERIMLDNGVSPPFHLREAFFIEDLVVAEVTKNILTPIDHGEPLDRLALDHIALVLGAHTLQSRSDTPAIPAVAPRGLDAWQKLRTEEMLRANLAGNISIANLANACALSESNFARRFRISFGNSVHQRLITLRLDYAKQLLLQSKKPFAEIAQLSGFYDQAAFSRSFRRVERLTPSLWQRLNSARTRSIENVNIDDSAPEQAYKTL